MPNVLNVWDESRQAYVPIPAIKGDPGEPGIPGEPGHTPVKGVDYFTDEDKQEFVQSANVVNRNLLDNWYFVNPVNQRGYNGTDFTNEYTIDRWKGGGYSQSFTKNSDGLSFPSGKNMWIEQIIEQGSSLVGKTITISAIVNNQLMTGTGVFGTKTGVNFGCSPFINNLHIEQREDNSVHLLTYSPLSVETTISAVKVEIGNKQTLAHQENGEWVLNEIPDYGEQLRRCQRYCVVSNWNASGSKISTDI